MDWININDAYPKNLQRILVIGSDGQMYAGTFYAGPDKFHVDGGGECRWYSDLENFTHWMSLPKPPKL